MKVRRVVTGQDAGGKSIFVSDDQVEPVTLSQITGPEFHFLWGADGTPALPADGLPPPRPTFFPPAPGYRFLIFVLPPEGAQDAPEDLDLGALMADMEEKFPGLNDHMEPDHPGMHTTDTVDLDLVISGEVYLELDDGAEVRLGPGDCVVQNGTRHAWHNRSSEPAVLFAALLGATHQ